MADPTLHPETTTTATDIHRSTSSGSETTWTAASSSVRHLGPAIAAAAAKPHTPSGNPCWDAIRRARSDSSSGQISLPDLRFLHCLGSGDIGSVYLAELKCGAIHGCLASIPWHRRPNRALSL